MKKIFSLIAMLMVSFTLSAQTMNVVVGNVTYQFPASEVGDMTFSGGSTMTAMGKTFLANEISSMFVDASSVTKNTVSITYNGTTASMKVAGNIAQYITPQINGAHVSIAQAAGVDDNVGEITYSLTGTATDGEFYMSGAYKATVELNGVTLTNTNPVFSGAAIHIDNSKRINIKVMTGTTNTLTDAANGSQKGCLYVKGHPEFKQKGTLNVYGNTKHGIKAGEYVSIKNATINVLKAAGDGLNCTEYFLIESGELNISGQTDDGLQVDLDGTTSTGTTTDHEDEDTGNIYINGGTVSIQVTAAGAKGIKTDGDVNITGGTINITSSAKGVWDTDDLETKASDCINADGSINISGGEVTTKSTGSGGRGMKCDNVFNLSGGTVSITTSGGLYYNNGTTENTNYTGNTDRISSDYYSAAKGIRAGSKATTSTSASGGVIINGGTISVTTSGYGAEGIESKNTLVVNDGYVTVNAYDDGINSSNDMTINGGYVYSRATNNDGLDANGNLYMKGGFVYAIGASSPELGVDANSEEQKKFYLTGGTLIAIGGVESGSSLTQSCYSTSSWSKGVWYALTFGSETIAFKTPASGGTTLVVSAASTPSLKSGVTVASGTEILSGNVQMNATVSGGSNVTLSSYTGGSGGGWGGRPW